MLKNERNYERMLDQVANEVAAEFRKNELPALFDSWRRVNQISLEAKCYENAKKKFLETAMLRTMVSKFATDGTEPFDQTVLPETRETLDYQNELFTTKSKYVFMTINPKPGITFSVLKKLIEKFVSKTFITQYYYVYEIRKAPDSGLHCHVLFHYTCRPADMKKSSQTLFNHVGDVKNPCCLNIKYIVEELIPQKISYMGGTKTVKKMAGVKATIEWREKNNILSYYESNPPLTCRVTTNTPIQEIQTDVI